MLNTSRENEDFQSIEIPTVPQTYFIRVYLEDGSSNRYDMVVTVDGNSDDYVTEETTSNSSKLIPILIMLIFQLLF